MGKSSKLTHKIALNTVGQTRFVLPSEIIRCESSNNYTTFFLADGDKIVVSRPIYEFELALADYGFIRCHQSHLVNYRFVKSWLKKDGDVLLLENGNQVPISRAKKDEVNQALERMDIDNQAN